MDKTKQMLAVILANIAYGAALSCFVVALGLKSVAIIAEMIETKENEFEEKFANGA